MQINICLTEDLNAKDADNSLSTLLISTVPDIQEVNISCSIRLNEMENYTTTHFTCEWPQEYFGSNAMISISALGNEMNQTCSSSEESGLKVENISPCRILFQRRSEA